MKIEEFFQKLRGHAVHDERPALVGSNQTHWSYARLLDDVEQLAQHLRDAKVRVLATLLDNGPQWILADLAALRAGTVHVPLPVFFTPGMVEAVLSASGADAVILPIGMPVPAGFDAAAEPFGDGLMVQRDAKSVSMPAGTAKVTYTSGSTGQPKGVCLTGQQMFRVTQGLVQAVDDLAIERHLNALPLAVLLENVAGVYAPLWRGATCISLSLRDVGVTGSSGFDPLACLRVLSACQAHSVILLPQMLRATAGALAGMGARAPETLRLVSVGGAAVGRVLLDQAHAVGLPAYEGYGLSEGASVQTLNLPAANRTGSAGRVLPHARIRIAQDGEIEISGSVFAGYLGHKAAAPIEWLPTGDLGELDEDGYLHVHGRKKHVLITGFGRNVSPELIETELRAEPEVLQAVVLGEGRPALGAVLWPLGANVSDSQLQAAISRANSRLPDYARIGTWQRAQTPFDAASGMSTTNGRPRRDAVAATYERQLFAFTSGGENSAPFDSSS